MKRKLFVWIICTMMLMLSVPVMAGEAVPTSGSIAVDILETKDDGKKVPVPGGTLTAYKVAEAKDGVYQYVDAFTGCSADLTTIGKGENGEPKLAKTLADFAAQKGLKGTTVTIDQNGKATFPGLELGYYLIVQETPAKGYQKIAPFSVTVPMRDEKTGEYIYNVKANPKPETAKPTDVPAPTGTPAPTVTPVPVNPIKPAPLLPQTGQLWWPVPLFAIAGAVLLISGLTSRKQKKGAR